MSTANDADDKAFWPAFIVGMVITAVGFGIYYQANVSMGGSSIPPFIMGALIAIFSPIGWIPAGIVAWLYGKLSESDASRETRPSSQLLASAPRNIIPDRPMGPDWERRRMEILERDRHQCQKCGYVSQVGMHVDHVVPLSRGGHPTSKKNLQALCERCNMDKGTSINSWTSHAPGKYHDGRVL